MDLSPDQQQARNDILAAVHSGEREIVLSGPAGSGKTTLMRQVLADLRELRRETALLAPTGKAAARLRDTTGAQTSTIHRALYKTVRESETGAVEFADPQTVARTVTRRPTGAWCTRQLPERPKSWSFSRCDAVPVYL